MRFRSSCCRDAIQDDCSRGGAIRSGLVGSRLVWLHIPIYLALSCICMTFVSLITVGVRVERTLASLVKISGLISQVYRPIERIGRVLVIWAICKHSCSVLFRVLSRYASRAILLNHGLRHLDRHKVTIGCSLFDDSTDDLSFTSLLKLVTLQLSMRLNHLSRFWRGISTVNKYDGGRISGCLWQQLLAPDSILLIVSLLHLLALIVHGLLARLILLLLGGLF